MFGGGAWQVTVNAASAEEPAVIGRERGLSPSTWQFPATPPIPTVCEPWVSPSTTVSPLVASAPWVLPSMMTAYPSVSGEDPVVVEVMRRLPVVAPQATAKVRLTVSPAVTLMERGLSPCTAQLVEAPANRTEWEPGSDLGKAQRGVRAERLGSAGVDLEGVTIDVRLSTGCGADDFQRAGVGPGQVLSAAAYADPRYDEEG